MSAIRAQQVMERYFAADSHSVDVLAADVVFSIMSTGQTYRGPDGVSQMLRDLYQVAFQATAELRGMVVGEKGAACEFDFVGVHTGEFAGIPATGKTVHVPFAVFYEVEADRIQRARVYMDMSVMMAQLTGD